MSLTVPNKYGHDVQYLGKYINNLSFMGLWTKSEKEDGRAKYIHHLCFHGFGFIFVAYPVYIMILKIVTDFEALDDIATTVDYGTLFCADIFRLYILFVRGPEYISFVQHFYKILAYETFNLGHKKGNVEKTNKLAGTFVGIYLITGFLSTSLAVLSPIAFYLLSSNMTEIPFMYQVSMPVDVHAEPTHSLVLLLQIGSWIYTCANFLVVDAFWFTVMILLTGQFALLTESCKYLEEELEGRDEFPIEYRRSFFQCIQHHQIIRRTVLRVEDLLNKIVLADFIHGMISITFIMLEMIIMLADKEWFRLGSLLEYLLVSVMHMFILTFIGNELILQEEEFAKALYRVPWYNDIKHLGRPMIMATAACRKPNKLSGGKFFFLSNEFFVGTMQTIFSYFMVLQTMHEEETS